MKFPCVPSNVRSRCSKPNGRPQYLSWVKLKIQDALLCYHRSLRTAFFGSAQKMETRDRRAFAARAAVLKHVVLIIYRVSLLTIFAIVGLATHYTALKISGYVQPNVYEASMRVRCSYEDNLASLFPVEHFSVNRTLLKRLIMSDALQVSFKVPSRPSSIFSIGTRLVEKIVSATGVGSMSLDSVNTSFDAHGKEMSELPVQDGHTSNGHSDEEDADPDYLEGKLGTICSTRGMYTDGRCFLEGGGSTKNTCDDPEKQVRQTPRVVVISSSRSCAVWSSTLVRDTCNMISCTRMSEL